MSEKNDKNISEKKLEDVNGGGFFSEYSEERYNEAGVKVLGWGICTMTVMNFRDRRSQRKMPANWYSSIITKNALPTA